MSQNELHDDQQQDNPDQSQRELEFCFRIHRDFEDGMENDITRQVSAYIEQNRYVTYCWLNKIFNDNRDWGLHLCPNGISISIFKYLFMLTNPFGYMDLKKAVMSLPSLYGKLLDSKKRLQEIIRQNNIKDVNNPVGELNRRLKSAKDTITRKSKELETTKQQVLDLQKLMALVGGGPEAFMQQWFGHQSFLSKQKERYVEDMRNSLSKLSDYSSMKLVYDELIENVFEKCLSIQVLAVLL